MDSGRLKYRGDLSLHSTHRIPNDPDRLFKYEGYLFPDTYDFYVGSSGKTAVQKLLTNFQNKFTPTLQAGCCDRYDGRPGGNASLGHSGRDWGCKANGNGIFGFP